MRTLVCAGGDLLLRGICSDLPVVVVVCIGSAWGRSAVIEPEGCQVLIGPRVFCFSGGLLQEVQGDWRVLAGWMLPC